MAIEPREPGEAGGHKEGGAARARNSSLARGAAGGPESTSPLRLVFVIVPLLVIAVAATNLLGLWTTSYQQAAREESQRQIERSPPDEEVIGEPRSVSVDAPSVVTEKAPAGSQPEFDAAVVVALIVSAAPEDGASAFRFCSPCHAGEKNGPSKIGPNLWGIVGERKAARPGFNYSMALKTKGGTWSYTELAKYLNDPRKFAPGTSMAFRGISDNGRIANLIAYMRTLSDNPAPLPN